MSLRLLRMGDDWERETKNGVSRYFKEEEGNNAFSIQIIIFVIK